MPGLHLELAAGRCPACTAASAAVHTYLRWLGDPTSDAERLRDRDLLCADHLHDAGHLAPLAASRALGASHAAWWRAAQVLLSLAPPPGEGLGVRIRTIPGVLRDAWTAGARMQRARVAARAAFDHLARPGQPARIARELAVRQRDRPCVACQAMLTASNRTIDLLGALLAGPAGVRFHEETDGLCIRHVAAASGRLTGRQRDIVRAHGQARAETLAWELQEWVRKSNWSVRYEPRGPEATAWQRAMVFILGEDVLATELLATEPETRPRPAA
jgi:hypothetical protein